MTKTLDKRNIFLSHSLSSLFFPTFAFSVCQLTAFGLAVMLRRSLSYAMIVQAERRTQASLDVMLRRSLSYAMIVQAERRTQAMLGRYAEAKPILCKDSANRGQYKTKATKTSKIVAVDSHRTLFNKQPKDDTTQSSSIQSPSVRNA